MKKLLAGGTKLQGLFSDSYSNCLKADRVFEAETSSRSENEVLASSATSKVLPEVHFFAVQRVGRHLYWLGLHSSAALCAEFQFPSVTESGSFNHLNFNTTNLCN